jgi:hypothetical protein
MRSGQKNPGWREILDKAVRNVNRLRRMSAEECRIRSAQVMRKSAERLLGIDQGEFGDGTFRRMLSPVWRDQTQEAIVRQIAQRMHSAPFMPGLADRDSTVRLMNDRFQFEQADLLVRAERAIHGRFDLLGLRNLSFGDPIDWCLEPVSEKRTGLVHWSRIPYLDGQAVGDKKFVWELNRHAHFVTLGQAYWITGNEKYADAFVSQIVSWMDANPPRRGINWASSLEVSFRSIAWVWALHFFAGSERLTPPIVWRLLKNLAQHGTYLRAYLSHYFSPNTHLTGEALGLFYIGMALSELANAGEWRNLGLKVLLDQLSKQVRNDGVYFEQTSYYHRYTVDFYLHLVLRARWEGLALPTWVDHTVCAMLDHLMWITRPDGSATLYGDDDGGRLLSLGNCPSDDFRDTLAIGAALYKRPDWKWVAEAASSDLVWLLGAEGVQSFDVIDARPPRERSRVFETSGYAILRDGWDRQSAYVFFDSGLHGALSAGHAHADALSFEFAVEGVVWVVDPGTYTYTGDAGARDRFRSTEGHNTVVIDGLAQSVPAGPFSWSYVTDANLVHCCESDNLLVEGAHDGYLRLASPVRHRRIAKLAMSEGIERSSYLVLTDTFEAAGAHRYEARLHFGEDCEVALNADKTAMILHSSGKQIMVLMRSLASDETEASVPLDVESGWISRCYGHRRRAPVLRGTTEAQGPATIITMLVPVRKGVYLDFEELFAVELAARRQGRTAALAASL